MASHWSPPVGRMGRWAIALAVVCAAVSLPTQLVLEPIPPVDPSASLLMASSCLLLASSGLILRRRAATAVNGSS